MVTFVLLNPSTATATQLDPTLRRCLRFADRENFGAMTILNLYAFRATDPDEMLAAADPVEPENDRAIASATGTVIAGWGTKAGAARVAHVRTLLPQLKALKITAGGHPQHPLYIHHAAPLLDWPNAPALSTP